MTVIIPLSDDCPPHQCESLMFEWSERLTGNAQRLLFLGNQAQVQLQSISQENVQMVLAQSTDFMSRAAQGLALCQSGSHGFVIHPDFEMDVQSLQSVLAVALDDEMVGFASPRTNLFSISQYPPSEAFDAARFDGRYLDRKWCLDAHAVAAPILPMWHVVPTVEPSIFFVSHKVLANFGIWQGDDNGAFDRWVMRVNRCGYVCALANRAFAFSSAQVVLRPYSLLNPISFSALTDKYFQTAVRRYFEGAHFQVEGLLLGLLPQDGKSSILIDLSRLGCFHNGTCELARKIITAMSELKDDRFTINLLADRKAYEFHRLHHLEGIRHVPLESTEKFHIGLMLGQPFSIEDIQNIEQRTLKTVYGMLDTIAEDCTYIVWKVDIKSIWRHVCQYASGLFFISQFAAKSFVNRYPDAAYKKAYTCLLPLTHSPESKVKLDDSEKAHQHILVMGNAFDHKGVEATSKILQKAFPNERIVAVGGRTAKDKNLEIFKSGFVPDDVFSQLYRRAKVVVMPSHVEGFGFGVVHGISAGVPVVARRIGVTNEILSGYKQHRGVTLYESDQVLVPAVEQAMSLSNSQVVGDVFNGWHQWVGGLLSFSADLSSDCIDFSYLVYRKNSIDLLNKASRLDRVIRRVKRIPLLGNWLIKCI